MTYLRKKIAVVLILVVLMILAGCASEPERVEKPKVVTDSLLSDQMVRLLDWKVVWEQFLPVESSEGLKRLEVVDDTLYVLTGRNYLVSLDRNNGQVNFTQQFGDPDIPVKGFAHYGRTFYSIVGNQLLELERQTGAQIDSSELTVNASCPATRNSSHFYLGSVNGFVRAIQASDKMRVFDVSGKTNGIVTSVFAREDYIVFSTGSGNIVRVKADEPERQWTYKAADGIADGMVMDDQQIFAAGKDTNLYSVNVGTGKLNWKYPVGIILETGPKVTESVVYQRASNQSLTAIDKDTGRFMWEVKSAIDLLAEDSGLAYVITDDGQIVVMNNQSYQREYSINVSQVDNYAVNVIDSRIYLADDNGRVVCLEPVVR